MTKCKHSPDDTRLWGIDDKGNWNYCINCGEKYYFKMNLTSGDFREELDRTIDNGRGFKL